ncbi:MAG: helix-turn-helix domain-containing protein [Clostridiales bacterium]|nr:helix-turn-helix domain-containing protein [Clostridiales bacterium]
MERMRYMISDASNMLQVEAHVLRYWEEELELDVPRNEMGHRYYTEENIRQFEQIRKLKAEGFQLKAIKMLIHNPTAEESAETENAGDEVSESVRECEMTGLQGKDSVSLQSTKEIQQGEGLSKLEQFQLMMNEIVRSAIAENNQALGQEIGLQVEEKVLKEMNYLVREREERAEERFRRLDEAIRNRQRRLPKEKRKIFHAPIHKAEEIG